MNKNDQKRKKRISRHRRVRAKAFGTPQKPRVAVFKSNKNVFVQFIDDEAGKTIISSKIVGDTKSKTKVNKTAKALSIGEMLADKAKAAGISEVVFDRGGFKFHGRVKAVADGLRKGGIKF